MSTPIKDGGAAFHAITCKNGDNYNPPTLQYHKGMSLRDWFAGMALAKVISLYQDENMSPEHVACCCYAVADTMIAAREVKP